eukprot:2616842-Prymnesium_polylepis.2
MLASAYDMPSACMLKHANPAVCFRDRPVSGVRPSRAHFPHQALPPSGDRGAGAARCGVRELGAMTWTKLGSGTWGSGDLRHRN